ncbi:hypothetical protein M5E88_12055 [Akkermansia muciniphila]|nr:hypothetical protein M5E88_12055 [Akkermansia muciniphila]
MIEAHRELTLWIIGHPQEAQKIVVEELRELTRSNIDPALIIHAWPRLVLTNEISEEKLHELAKDTVRTGFYKKLPTSKASSGMIKIIPPMSRLSIRNVSKSYFSRKNRFWLFLPPIWT